ncbi:MAG: hypothetical protein RBS39_06610 [Phycisphaerales bacterium]|jgi:hypothetical protein|nr:hypothetical protein [Phycisphaerales bacterium]
MSTGMMIRSVWTLAIVAALVMTWLSAPRALRSQRDLARARVQLDLAAQDTAEAATITADLDGLVPDRNPSTPSEPQRGSLAERAARALARAGIDPASLVSVTPAPIPGTNATTDERATVVLSGVTLPQLGRLLTTWSDAEPGLAFRAIDLERGRDEDAAPGQDVPARAVLTIEGSVR